MLFNKYRRRRRGKSIVPFVSQVFYMQPQKQTVLIITSAIIMAVMVFSGVLLFRQSDHGDLMTRGKWLMKQGKAALAVQEFETLVRHHRGSFEGHIQLGNAYMAIDESEKAAREFRIASRLKSGNLRDSGAHVALSRMMVAQGKYEDAEKQLFQAYQAQRKNREDPELLLALVDLYEDWGDSFQEKTPPDYENAFLKYSSALRYIKSLEQQEPISEKLVSTAQRLSTVYENNKDYDKAIAVMKRALHYERTADNMVAIAALYEQKEDLDKAILWYRQAYELDPKVISLKLSMMLMRKAHELSEAHLNKEAETYFAEAKKINETVKLPVEMLYPVEVTNVALTYKVDPASFDLEPQLNFQLANAGSYPISFLAVKVHFLTGNQKLADAEQIVASSRDPLTSKNEPRGVRVIDVKPSGSIPLEDLERGKLRVKIMVSYTDDINAKWIDVKNAEIMVHEAQNIEDVKNHHPG